MKIALECHSTLIEKSLHIFLKPFIVPLKQCEFVITDREIEFQKPTFYIGTPKANLTKPFSKETLYKSLQIFHNEIDNKIMSKKENIVRLDKQANLEEKISHLTENFSKNLISIIREHYEK